MGKSEIDRLRPSQLNLQVGQRMTTNGLVQNGEETMGLPDDMVFLDNQVAGHMNDGKHIGMLKYKGMILKPITKPACGERESTFYEELSKSHDASLKEMREFVPQYYGKEVVRIGDKLVDSLVLEDLTKGFKEPCIMDIKIGRRTWDPQASYEKIMKEDAKYHETKRDLGLCVPGFQVYKLTNGRLRKYGKEYGKKLNKDTLIDALKIFLNADIAWCRSLLVQLLMNLWRIQNWSKKQHSIRLYSSSILLIYDARRLRQTLEINGTIRPAKLKSTLRRANSLYRPLSLAVLHDKEAARTGFSGQLNEDGPIFPNAANSRTADRVLPTPKQVERKPVATLKRMHSFQNNYDKDLQNIRNNYVYMLDDLVSEERRQLWATVKMIDFAHAYPSESNNVDTNYLDGVESLVKILEGFLMESEAGN